MANFLEEKRKEIDARLRELRPLVDEFNQLEKAASALAGVGGGAKPRARRASTGPRRKRGRPRGSGNRAKQALERSGKREQELAEDPPAVTAAILTAGTELADTMGIKANYLYRVMPTLQKEGQVKKRDKGWHPA